MIRSKHHKKGDQCQVCSFDYIVQLISEKRGNPYRTSTDFTQRICTVFSIKNSFIEYSLFQINSKTNKKQKQFLIHSSKVWKRILHPGSPSFPMTTTWMEIFLMLGSPFYCLNIWIIIICFKKYILYRLFYEKAVKIYTGNNFLFFNLMIITRSVLIVIHPNTCLDQVQICRKWWQTTCTFWFITKGWV